MAKKYNIRWRPDDTRRLASRVRAFNGKITRLTNQFPDLVDYLPQRISTQQIREQVKTRQDFNNMLNSLKRFSQKDAAKPILTAQGVKTTQWEIRETQIRVGVINRRRSQELKRAAPSTEKGTMGSVEQNSLKPKRFDPNRISQRDWDRFIQNTQRQARSTYSQERAETYKQNYLDAIMRNLFNDETAELAEQLYNLIAGAPPSVIYESYYDDPVLQIQFTSDPIPASVILLNALERWSQLLGAAV